MQGLGILRGMHRAPAGADNPEQEPMIKSLKNFVANETGATAIEYALIASLIAVAIIASLTAVSGSLQNVFSEVSTAMK
jgi:pilus assembly protein Flp/PilA